MGIFPEAVKTLEKRDPESVTLGQESDGYKSPSLAIDIFVCCDDDCGKLSNRFDQRTPPTLPF